MAHIEARIPRIGAGLLALGLLLYLPGLTLSAVGAPPANVTICHAAGQVETTQFATLNLPYAAVYGIGGHFYENGSTRAGHEQDYLGACLDVDPTTSIEVAPELPPTTLDLASTTTLDHASTSTLADSSTTTTTVVDSSTTTFEVSATTTLPDSTTSTVEASPTTTLPDSTTTTVGGSPSTTIVDASVTTTLDASTTTFQDTSATSVVEETATTGGAITGTAESETTSTLDGADTGEYDDVAVSPGGATPEVADDEAVDAVATLPLTGFDAPLAVPGLLLIVTGLLTIAFGGHFGLEGVESGRLRLGIHRGRHESRVD